MNDSAPTVTILKGHILDKLKELPDESVHMCMTSPPYWGLRDYSRCECSINYGGAMGPEISGGGQMSPDPRNHKKPNPNCPKCHGTGKDDSLTVVWDAKEGCEHEWGEKIPREKKGGFKAPQESQEDANLTAIPNSGDSGSFCLRCNAWRGQLGLEPTPDLYVQHIVRVFREVKRVLRDDGTLWLNMGDCYATSQSGSGGINEFSKAKRTEGMYFESRKFEHGLKPKDLVGMPWRVAFALQADGWWLRSDIIWAKPNPMPESVTDRPTKAHEYVFLLTKNARYFYDMDAVREDNASSSVERASHHLPNPIDNPDYSGKQTEDYKKYPLLANMNPMGRNLRTVWTITTQPYPEAHFATFPEALAERCIKAGTSEKGCCATCGAPWERVVDAKPNPSKAAFDPDSRGWSNTHQKTSNPQSSASLHRNPGGVYREAQTIGFRPTCDHDGDPVPFVVLDPFAGSGTVGKVARDLGRSSILIEIKEEYVNLMKERVDYAHKPLEQFER